MSNTITPGVVAASPPDVREAIRMWILQEFSLDPAQVASIEFGGDDENGATATITFVEGTKVKDADGKNTDEDREPMTQPLYSPLPWDLDDLPDAVDTKAKSLSPDDISDNPTTEQPGQTKEESDAAAASTGNDTKNYDDANN